MLVTVKVLLAPWNEPKCSKVSEETVNVSLLRTIEVSQTDASKLVNDIG
jgi:hypothetical protein